MLYINATTMRRVGLLDASALGDIWARLEDGLIAVGEGRAHLPLDAYLRSVAIIGWTMLIFGILLYWADQFGETTRTQENWSLTDAMVVGVWQAIALIPGTSRSGITITGARFLGYNRHDAAKLSMLMSVPTIIASGMLLSGEAIMNADLALLRDCGIAAALAFVAALLALTIMMRLLRSVSFTPYVIYRVVLGVILLVIAYS